MSTIDDPTCGGGHHFALGGGNRGDHGGDEEYDSDYGDDDFDDEPGERSIDFHLVISSGFSIVFSKQKGAYRAVKNSTDLYLRVSSNNACCC